MVPTVVKPPPTPLQYTPPPCGLKEEEEEEEEGELELGILRQFTFSSELQVLIKQRHHTLCMYCATAMFLLVLSEDMESPTIVYYCGTVVTTLPLSPAYECDGACSALSRPSSLPRLYEGSTRDHPETL